MQKRVGELQWQQIAVDNDDADNKSYSNNALWLRNVYKRFDAGHTNVALSGIEFGYDRIVYSWDDYKWYIGGVGYISGGNSKFHNNRLDISGYGIGAYTMLIDETGWFADLVFRQHFIDIDNVGIKSDYHASSINVELGKEFVFGDDTDILQWFMKPSIEGNYIKVHGTRVGDYNVQNSVSNMLSLSVLVGPRWNFTDGKKFQFYGKIGYTFDNSDDVEVIVDGVGVKQEMFNNTFETGIGVNYRVADGSTNIYFEMSSINGADYSEISGNLGLRYEF